MVRECKWCRRNTQHIPVRRAVCHHPYKSIKAYMCSECYTEWLRCTVHKTYTSLKVPLPLEGGRCTCVDEEELWALRVAAQLRKYYGKEGRK